MFYLEQSGCLRRTSAASTTDFSLCPQWLHRRYRTCNGP